MKNNAWYHKYSFIVFLVVAAGGLSMAIQMMFAPEASSSLLTAHGAQISGTIRNEAAALALLHFLTQWVGAALFGSNMLTAFIALTAWRKGDRWAWFAFLYWPFLFLYHYNLAGAGVENYTQLVMLALVVVVLVVNARRFLWPDRSAEPAAAIHPQT